MALRTIVLEGDSCLTKVCRPVTAFNGRLHQLLDDMAQTMHEANGVGLAAPQVGLLKRIVVIDIGEGVIELINPEIISASGSQTDDEGCLSVPGVYGYVTRPTWAKIRAQDRFGNWFEREGEGIVAQCFCHETEHLDGHLFIEKVEEYVDVEQMQDGEEE